MMDKKILKEKLDNVGLLSWVVGWVTVSIYYLIDDLLDLLEITPEWIGGLLSWLIYAVFVFVSFIIVGFIIRKNRDKEE
jgi:hypothetical protein